MSAASPESPRSRLEQSRALHERARSFVRAFEGGAAMPEAFDALATDIARFQAAHIEGYARLCRAKGIEPAALTTASTIPAVPTDAFKLTRVAAFDAEDDRAVFRTSGTTQGARGEHAMRDPGSYDAAALAFGRAWLARDLERPVPVVVLAPPPAEAKDSSLGHMCRLFANAFGTPEPEDKTFLLQDGVLDISTFDERVAFALARGEPMLVLGTSFAFVHFVDAVGRDQTFELPNGSRVMQTGGYKGRSREVPPEVLRVDLARVFRIDERAIVGEYGMTELSSQFYEQTLFDPDAPRGLYAEPPWARVVPVDPETTAEVPPGAIGIAKIIDLMNVDSAVAVLTQDRVRRSLDPDRPGFELLGRLPGAPPRGCSIAIDELLGR